MTSAFKEPISLNGSWEFRFEENKPLEETDFSSFEATDVIPVPCCFDVLPKWYLKRGTGLYRRKFVLAEPVENATLVIDGMGLRGAFAIDGRSLGVHPFPYAKLELETGPLAAGEHTVCAALDNRFDLATMKLARTFYDFYFYGGFYRGVALSFDRRKLFVRTRDYVRGLVEVEAVGFAEKDFDATLIFDGVNKVPVTFKNSRAAVTVPDHRVWSPDSPALHTVALDSVAGPSARFGIREIKAADKKIRLNGKEIFLKGVNRHDSHIEFGVATSESQMIRDIQTIKSFGANFVRGAHYQQSQRFLDLCDENGLLVWEESLGWGNGQSYTDAGPGDALTDPVFFEQQIKQTRDMVRESINHPCVVISAFLNECGSNRPEALKLVDALIETIRAEDTGHLITFACNLGGNDICNAHTDIVAFNSYPGTIPNLPGEPDDLREKVSENFNGLVKHFRSKYPDKPIMVSESGVGARYGEHDPAAPFWSEEFQEEYLRDIMETLWANPDVCGFSVWQFKDNRTFSRNSRDQPAKLLGCSVAGLVDFQGRPKLSVATVREFFAKK